MPYLIDGHNLIGQLPDITLGDPNDEAQLVTKLKAFCARTGKKCHVVFDNGLPGGVSKLSNSTVKVQFASVPGNADNIMIARIRKTRDVNGWYVVSSDEHVLSIARRKGMKILRSPEFADRMRQVAKVIPKEENPNPHITQDEVDEWERLFNQGNK